MDFAFDARTEELRAQLLSFMDEHVYLAEPVFAEQVAQAAASGSIWQRPAVIDELKEKARAQGLWNLFLTVRRHMQATMGIRSARSRPSRGLTNLQYAPLAEITGRSGAIAPEALNCAAPDTGNMEVLAEFGSPRAGRALADAAARRDDQVGVLHDRARRRLIRRHQHRDQDRAGRRRVT